MGSLLELRSQLRNLQWFGEVNRRGFVKITKKLDKKVPSHATQHRYISTKVDLCPFAQDTTTSQLRADINAWLAVLGGPQNQDAAKPEHSARTLGRHGGPSAQAMSAVPAEFVARLEDAVRKDDASALGAALLESHLIGKGAPAKAQGVLLILLQRAISARSTNAMSLLLTHVSLLDEPDDINKRNCIHRLIIHIGRKKTATSTQRDLAAGSFPFPGPIQRYAQHYITPATSPLAEEKTSKAAAVSDDLGEDGEAVHLLLSLLESLGPQQRDALRAKDIFGRIPLHYAAQFGLRVVCQVLMKKMQDWGLFNVDGGIDAPEWQDEEGHAPVHLSVLGGHPLTTMALLRGEDWDGVSSDKAEMRRKILKSSAVLTVATKANFTQIVQMLVDAGVDVNWSDRTGETALHVAARFGHAECAEVLIRGAQHQKANLDVAESSFAWTPLHIAAVDGHMSVARLLVDAGADVDRLDSSGWTAKEHASLRGHLDIARLLAAHSRPELDMSRAPDDKKSAAGPASSEVSSSGNRRPNGSSQPVEPIKTFGHRYLTDESMVLVSLGSMDVRKNAKAVTLDKVPLTAAHATKLDTALSVVVSAQGAHGEPFVVDLPVHENISTDPIVFMTTDAAKVKLLFDIVPTYSGNKNKKIGRGVALLSSIRPAVGNKRMNLQGDVCVPILSSELDVIGTVNFNFLVITPFHHPSMEVTSRQTYWKKMTGPMVIGHRGLGKNLASNKSLQLGENTVPSFIAAANLGAQYVEFDVQLTKDHVPVIYHDFLVSETGFDAPVHTLTLEQFLHLNPDASRSALPSPSPSPAPNPFLRLQQQQQQQQQDPFSNPRQRSMSMHQPSTTPNPLHERMKHTRDFKAKGFKANSRGTVIQAPFATLDDLFRQLPEAIGFNVELKYPMLHESEEHDMDAYAVELNSFCDAVLAKVYDHLGRQRRRVIFSSFNPDVCLCLSFKQPSVPILFLTDAGSCEVGDVRATSLQEAVRFARRWNLLGIVSAAEPFVISPRLVRVVKESGLVCVSYGVQNNRTELVEVSFFPFLCEVLGGWLTVSTAPS
jgi:glycerophosphodiester phosphodiesterase